MATTEDFIQYVCEQIDAIGISRYKKMFGEYMVYINDKPVLLVCDNVVFVKMLEPLKEYLAEAETGTPYKGAKEHYILDIDNRDLSEKVVSILESITPVPKPRKKKVLE